ncbi:MAG: hydrogenase iron-sulfur subunit [Candidatus Helarchaeota archaeon]|nr:hydrogenase iron-sulfur subunit [Candidatus Helarchaeota archaeon]
MSEKNPKILMIACMQCGYAAADLAGVLKIQYDPSIRIIRVPCTGRIDITHMLRGLVDGADAVICVG